VRLGGREFIIREPRDPKEHRELMDVQARIWGGEGYEEVVPYHVTIALTKAGGLVLGAYELPSGKCVGVSIAFPSFLNYRSLYSHMTGVLPSYRYLGLGYYLKLAQRDYGLGLGIELIYWTYDPLLAPNARFNVGKLGVIFRRYIVNHYGVTQLSYGRGVESDRVVAEWFITSERVCKFLEGRWGSYGLSHYLSVGAKQVLKALGDPPNQRPSEPTLTTDYDVVIIEVPKDFSYLAEHSPELAREWRLVSREVFKYYLSRGYVGIDFIKKVGGGGYYVLWRAPIEEVLKGVNPVPTTKEPHD